MSANRVQEFCSGLGPLWVRWTFCAFLLTFAYFIWHCWRDKDSLVDLKVFKNRNFAIGRVLILSFGIGIYATVTVLPLFYQELLGYTAFTAGLVVAPARPGVHLRHAHHRLPLQ
jgi:MFS transporter, DHA2 family, multidrug resistance protein